MRAQLPPRVERCLPWPTLGQEIEDFRKEVRELEELDPPPRGQIRIKKVVFQGVTQMPESAQRELAESIKKRTFEDEDGGWLDEIQEIDVRGAWQERGYFQVKVSAKADIETGGPELAWATVTIRVDEGLQYRLGKLTFSVGTVFPQETLRKLIPLREGDIFNIEKIRLGLEALARLYGSKGYIDFTSAPDTDIDKSRQRISLMLWLDEQRQYRIGKVEVLGLNRKLERRLKSKLRPGEPFNYKAVDEFFKMNKAVLPADASTAWDMSMKRDMKNNMVDLLFDFRACPSM